MPTLVYFFASAFVLFGARPVLAATSNSLQSFTINYNFDTILTNPAAIGPEIREYDLLYFQNMNPINQSLAVTGVIPHTLPNQAAFTANTALLDLDGTDFRITSKYFRSSIAAFDAVSWYYGCALASAEIIASTPVTCNITATGYDISGKKAAQQTFTYTATALRQDLNYAKFNSKFVGLEYVTFTVSNSLTTSAVFDDFIAKVYQLSTAPYY